MSVYSGHDSEFRRPTTRESGEGVHALRVRAEWLSVAPVGFQLQTGKYRCFQPNFWRFCPSSEPRCRDTSERIWPPVAWPSVKDLGAHDLGVVVRLHTRSKSVTGVHPQAHTI